MTDPASSLLVRYGLIRREQIIEAERLRQRVGGTLGEALVRLGITDEEHLVDFYHKRLMVPRLDPTDFQRVHKRALAALPADMAAEFRVFPVAVDAEGALTLAMADPSDAHVVDEVIFFTGRFCQRAVAAESVIRAAIEHHYGVRFNSPNPSTPAGPNPIEPAEEPFLLLTKVKVSEDALPVIEMDLPTASDDELSDDGPPLPGVSATLLTKRKAITPPESPPESPEDSEPILLDRRAARGDSRTPTLTGMPTVSVPDPPLARLRSTSTREEIATTLLDYIAEMTPRTALFVMRKRELHGYDGRGAVDVDGIKRLVITVDAPSLFRDVIQSRLPYRGPLPETPANTAFSQMVGALEGDVLMMPISVRDKVICLVYADGVATALPDAALHAVSREAGLAYERVILATKR